MRGPFGSNWLKAGPGDSILFNGNIKCKMSLCITQPFKKLILILFSFCLLRVKICTSVTGLFGCQGSHVCRFIVNTLFKK